MRNPGNFGADAITHLPDDLINKILTYLPLRVAVRTSILSREWKDKWLSIPEIVFDFRLTRSFTLTRKSQLERLIYQVLIHHRGPIDKFVFQARGYESSPDVDQWILFLSQQKLQDFTLEFHCENKHILPSHFFAFQHLRHLKLNSCAFEPSPTFQGFSKLVTLDFKTVNFVPEIFVQFISRCLLLERVRLNDCTDFDSVEFEAPSLRFLTYHGFFKSIRFKNCPRLAEVTLSTYTLLDTSKSSKYFDFLPTMEKVHVYQNLLQSFGVGGVPKRFPHSLRSLKFLFLSMKMDSIEEVSFALCLIRSSPNLEVLDIVLYSHQVKEAVMEFIRAQENPDRFLNQLKRVHLEYVHYAEPQMEFIKCLLASASALEEMVISPCLNPLYAGSRLSLTNELKQLPRASPNAVIHVKRACRDCMRDRWFKLV